MGEPPPPLGTFDDSGPDPMEAIDRAERTAGVRRAVQRHRPARDLAAAPLDRRGPADRRPTGRAAGARGPAAPDRGAARAGASLGRAHPTGVRDGIISPMAEISGVITAMVTPFGDEGEVDHEAARALAASARRAGLARTCRGGHDGRVADALGRREARAARGASSEEVGDRATVICGTGTNDTAHTVELTKRRLRRAAQTPSSSSRPTTTSPTRPGFALTSRRSPQAAGATPIVLYNIPSRCVVNLSVDFMAELARDLDNVVAVKQANNDELGPDRGPGPARRQRRDLPAHPGDRRNRRDPGRLTPRRSRDAGRSTRLTRRARARRAHELESELHPVYEALTVTANPIPVKAGLEMLGVIGGAMRLPMVPASAQERSVVRSGAGAPRPAGRGGRRLMRNAPRERQAQHPPLGRPGRDRQEHDGRRARRPDRDRRHRADVPDGRDARDRPRAAGLLLAAGARRATSTRSCSPTATRTTSGRCRTCCARSGMPTAIYGGPLTIGLVRSKLEEHKLRDAPLEVLDPGEKVQAGPFEIEMIHMSHSIPDARAVAVTVGPGHGPDHRRLQVRPDPGRRRPRRRLAPRRARPRGRALPLRRLDQRRPPWRSPPPSPRSARPCSRCSRAARGGSSSPPSPPTSTASSR